MIGELTGFYIHLPDSMPESAMEALDSGLQRLTEFQERIKSENPSWLHSTPGLIVRKHSALGSFQKSGIEILECPDDPYQALKSILGRGELPVDDLNARSETFAFFYGLFPLLDVELSLDLFRRHREFLSSYTYAENVPPGMTPDFVTPELFELDKRPEGDLRSFVFKNFHELDAEVSFYEPDLRIHRLNFQALDHRSITLCKRVSDAFKRKEVKSTLQELHHLLEQEPEVIRVSPSYLELELSSQSPVKDRLQLPATGGTLSDSNRKSILKQLDSFLPGDVTVCLGGLGDSGADAGAPEFSLSLLEHPAVKQVIVETYGYHMQPWMEHLQEQRVRWEPLNTSSRLSFIIRLCSLRPDRYEYFYSGGDLKRMLSQLDLVSEYLKSGDGPAFSVYLEMQKIKEVEDEIHDFFQKYDPTIFTPILRKQNTYAGALEDRKVADLTPPIRGFCWHLARDLYINSEGKIPVCRQIPEGESKSNSEGSMDAATEGLDLEKAFQANQEYYIQSIRGQHGKIPAPCLKCDEWYLFQG